MKCNIPDIMHRFKGSQEKSECGNINEKEKKSRDSI